MRRTLLRQVYPTYLATVLASVLAIGLVSTTVVRRFVYDLARYELSDMIVLTEHRFFPDGVDAPGPGADEDLSRLFRGLQVRVTVIMPDGKVSADSVAIASDLENHGGRPEVIAALSGSEGSAIRRSASVDRELLYLAKPVVRDGKVIAVLRASMPLPFLRDRLAGLYLQIALGIAAVVAGAAAMAFATVRRINRPLLVLGNAARRFAAGDLDFRSRIDQPEEIAVLSSTFDSMAAELKERIADVERRRREAEAILSGLAEGVLVLDSELRILRTNAAADALFAAPGSGPVLGRPLMEASRSTELPRYAARALAEGIPVEGDVSLWGSTQKRLRVYAAPIIQDSGTGCLLVLHDVTRLERLETVRRDFVANVSHELKTPITSIKGFVETLKDGALEDPEQARRFLAIIDKHASRLESIIEDLLALARLEEQEGAILEVEPVDASALVAEAASVCARAAEAKGIRIEQSCPEGLEAQASAHLLERALVNLVDNAIKYSEAGTTVKISCSSTGNGIEFEVADRGRGIPAKDLPRIFERFYRVDKARSRELGGTGLGLSIVKHIATLHGGSVSVESWEGEGSTFTIALPDRTRSQGES